MSSTGGRVRARVVRSLPPRAPTRATMRACYRLAPGHSIAVVALSVAGAALGLGQVFAVAGLIGAISGQAASGIAGPVAALALLTCAATAARHASGYSVEVIGQRLRGDAERRLMALNMAPVGIGHLEDPAYHDFLEVAKGQLERWGAANSVWGVTESFTSLVNGATRAAVLVAFGWWAPLLLGGSAVVLHRTSYVQFENLMRGWQRDAEHLRRADYYRELTLTAAGAKEVRVFGLRDWLVEQFSDTWLTSMRAVWRERTAASWVAAAAVAAVSAALGLVVWRIGIEVTAGRRSIESLLVLVTSALGLVEAGLLSNAQVYAAGASGSLLAIEEAQRARVTAAADVASGSHPADAMPTDAIAFQAVSFRYPGAAHDTFTGLDLTIRAGETLALVGLNGAGKTTLVKLLTRLYEPTGGRITVDGVDLAGLDVVSWRRRVAVVFQDFASWKLAVRDNVDLNHAAADDDALLTALDRAGARQLVDALPAGMDTVLSAEFDGGVDLSGGQWQRIALARALFAVRAGGVLVLDEPTASQDVRAEAELFDRLVDVTRGTTTLLISHRFSTVRRADRIVVIDEGRVVEDGSHDDLLASAGRYARLYRAQASHVVDAPPQEEGPR